MKEIIKEKLKNASGSIGVYYENLVTGEKLGVIKGRADDVFEAASVIKLWIMSAVYEQIEQGRLDPEMMIEIKEDVMVPFPGVPDYNKDRLQGCLTEDMFPESGVLNYLHPGLQITLRDLVRLMILVSDNTAANVLIDMLGIREINEHIMSLGAEKTILVRELFDTSPEMRGRENLFSLTEAADYFRMMYEGRLVSPEASREMLALLQNQQNTYKMPFYIRQLPIAHKTGEDTGIENDVGIIFAEEPFVFCFASNGADEPEAVRLCQDLARDLVNRDEQEQE